MKEFKLKWSDWFGRDVYIVKNDPLFEFFWKDNMENISKRHIVSLVIKEYLWIKSIWINNDWEFKYLLSDEEWRLWTDVILNNVCNIFDLPENYLQWSIDLLREWKDWIQKWKWPN